MAKGYWVSSYRKINDPSAVAAYAELAGPAIAAAGGRALARGGKVEAKEFGLQERTVLIEFDSYEQALATYNSGPYQEALKRLGNAVERDFRIIEGVD